MIRKAIISGDLREGEAIPSVRAIAKLQRVSIQTVLNALPALLISGALEKRVGVGIFVKAGARKMLMAHAMEALREEEIPAMVAHARLLGISSEEITRLVNKTLEA